MRRSMLFLPGNTPNMIINGDALGADSIILDLEDAVSPDEKDAARLLVKSAIEGMGFAIPSNTAIEISNDLISFGYVANRVRLGIEVSNYVSSYFSTETSSGVSIRNITDDSPLKGTDVKVGDVITAINGVQTNNFQSLFSEMGKYSPGDTVTLTILRPATAGNNSSVFKVDVTFVADNGETQK